MPEYLVTKSAPDEIYGKRTKAGDLLTLTTEEAGHHVRKGHLVLKADPAVETKPALPAPKVDNGKRN